jgi:hypothetical protein
LPATEPTQPGQCRGCTAPLPRRKDGTLHKTRAWCSAACADRITYDHLWTWARSRAVKENAASERGPHCERCRRPRVAMAIAREYGIDACDGPLEVNHIAPLVGAYRSWSCLNHRENLEVVCHGCHKAITAQQRRSRKAVA